MFTLNRDDAEEERDFDRRTTLIFSLFYEYSTVGMDRIETLSPLRIKFVASWKKILTNEPRINAN